MGIFATAEGRSHSHLRGYKSRAESWSKRLTAACARTLHENSFLFSAAVKTFRALQRAGVNCTPNHFYWPVPDLAELEKSEWPTYPYPPACSFRLRQQKELARDFFDLYAPEYQLDSQEIESSYHYGNGYFESCDAEVAYCMVRHWKPRRIIEIGSGYSSRVMAAALRTNIEKDAIAGELITVDPSPERLPTDGLGDVATVIAAPVQHLDMSLFSSLQPDDVLFIDSSHVVGVGTDVVREYLQILPALRPGVLIHVHDIFLPFDYPREAVLKNLWFWSEQYLLQAFLSFNTQFEVLWSASAMQNEYPDILEQCFPRWKHSYRDIPEVKRSFIPTIDHDHVWPSSFWMRRVQA
jgi:predicted O-methyltransferase YrrM